MLVAVSVSGRAEGHFDRGKTHGCISSDAVHGQHGNPPVDRLRWTVRVMPGCNVLIDHATDKAGHLADHAKQVACTQGTVPASTLTASRRRDARNAWVSWHGR